MAVVNLNPTRMELARLKKRLLTAVRGHKLLKDKRDELMRRFLEIAKYNRELRIKVENAVKKANQEFMLADAVVSDKETKTALLCPREDIYIDVEYRNIMSVNVPLFELKNRLSDNSDMYCYGYAFTSADLDDAVLSLSSVFDDMIKLAQIEKSCQLLSSEIEKTRRRVNALEYVVIPQTKEKIRYVSMKLEENERSTQTRLMKVKDMVLVKK